MSNREITGRLMNMDYSTYHFKDSVDLLGSGKRPGFTGD
jgi:hypothetical protein